MARKAKRPAGKKTKAKKPAVKPAKKKVTKKVVKKLTSKAKSTRTASRTAVKPARRKSPGAKKVKKGFVMRAVKAIVEAVAPLTPVKSTEQLAASDKNSRRNEEPSGS